MADRLTVKAAFRDGGSARVHLEETAEHEDAASEVRAYLDRGAVWVVVVRGEGAGAKLSEKTRNGG